MQLNEKPAFDLERFQEEDLLKRDLLDWWVRWVSSSEPTRCEEQALDELARRMQRRMDQLALRARLEG